jgi:multidrug efflux pump subunit AcrB
MSIASYAMSHKRVIHFFLAFSIIGGVISFEELGKAEDAPFVIKEAVLTTQYPGANQFEVEEQVTEVIERTVQATRGVDFIKSESRAGISFIKVAFFESIPKEEFKQIWDELRRKVEDAQLELPPGCLPTMINDDFGDVFGVYYALTADEGFEYSELEDYAEFLKREIVPISEVSKVDLFGVQSKVINVEISEEKLSNAGVNPNQIVATIQAQNKLVNSGKIPTGQNEIRVEAPGTYQSVEEIENLIITGDDGSVFRLKDLTTITRDYLDPAFIKMRMNGKRSIGIGISTRVGGNSVLMGDMVAEKLETLKSLIPVGMEIEGIYFENKVAVEANNNFIKNLIISVSTVVIIILFIMGVRSGVLIGTSLIFSILTTLVFMMLFGIDLHRTSLAAIIVAMGMLVDNAIVVTDNANIAMKRGVPKVKALIDGATIPQWGLLGATFIAIMSFLPLFLAGSNTAEIIKPLFVVLAISLGLSWIFALIQTTVYGEFILKEPKKGAEMKDPFAGKFFVKLKAFIEKCIAFRWVTIGAVVVTFFISMFLFGTVKQSFFPAIHKPMFKIDYFLPQGTSIAQVEKDMKEIEQYILSKEEVKNVSITIGSGPLRYYLATVSWFGRPNLANLLIETEDYKQADALMYDMKDYLESNYPDAMSIFYKFKVSPAPDAIIEPTFLGPDPDVLRELTEKAKEIMRQDPLEENIRDSWGNKTMKWNPVYSQNKGQRLGVSRENMAMAIKRITDGQNVGDYREGDDIVPILIKDINRDKYDYGNLGSLPVYTSTGNTITLDRVVEKYEVKWEEFMVRRYNRQRALSAMSDPIWGIENPEVEAWLMPKLNAMELPEGYSIFWDGMYKKQLDTQNAIMAKLGISMFLIVSVLIVLFNSYRKVTMILFMIPLVLIGVTAGFLLTGQFFGFFAILGLLGLIGMVIKNAIVLLDQTDLEIQENKRTPYDAIVLSAQSRAVPVGLAAGTTILGMVPLLPDPMFGGMAATIMGGLAIATILTIIVLPVLYATMYKLRKPENAK